MPDQPQNQPPPTAKKEQIADIEFPVYGLDLSQEFDLQRPDTTPTGINVRGWEPQTYRNRGGSRNGISKYVPVPVATSPTTVLIQDLNIVVTTSQTELLGNFGFSLSNTGGAIPSPQFPGFFVPIYGSGVMLNKNGGATSPSTNGFAGVTTSGGTGPTFFANLFVGQTGQTVVALSGSGNLASGFGFIAAQANSPSGRQFYIQPPTFVS